MQIPENNHPLIMGIINLTPDSFYSQTRQNISIQSDDLYDSNFKVEFTIKKIYLATMVAVTSIRR